MTQDQYAQLVRTLGPVVRDLVDRVVEEKIAARIQPAPTPFATPPTSAKPRLKFRGPWVSGTAYAVGDGVLVEGQGWECTQAHSAGTPPHLADPCWRRIHVQPGPHRGLV